MDQKLIHRIGITLIPKIGPVTTKNLISYCGSAFEVFTSSKKALMAIPGVGASIARNILRQDVLNTAEQEARKLEKFGIQSIFYLDHEYSQRLKNYIDCPVMLYCKGNANLNAKRIISIVGTRNPSPRGLSFTRELVRQIEPLGVMIVSGMAYGIDVAAHKASLENEMLTVGVLGNGLGTIYPKSHRSIARKVIERGALISEYTMNIGPDKVNFPMRNRIVAGMCDALVVVETPKKGGSIITTRLANQYNKDVFAVPGRLNDVKSVGCNHLIKTHQAALIESGKDIAYVMGWEEESSSTLNGYQQSLFEELDTEELQIVELLKNSEHLEIDDLSLQVGMKPGNLSSLLLNLEFKGLVKPLPGKRYMLV